MTLADLGRHSRPLAARHSFGRRVRLVIPKDIGCYLGLVLGRYWVVLGGIGAHLMLG